jgi:hypothetical protein
MLLSVPYVFSAKVVKNRKRAEEEVYLKGVVDVVIREAAAQEAPVAVRVTPRGEDEAASEYRLFDGVLHRPYVVSMAAGDPEVQRDLAWLKGVTTGKVADGPLVDRNARSKAAGAVDRDALGREVREWRASGDEDRLAQIRDAAAALIAVDGMLWEKSGEPLLRLWTGREYFQERGPSVDLVEGPQSNCSDEVIFRLDEARLIQGAFPHRFGDGVEAEDLLPEIEIMAADCLSFPATARAVVEVGASIVSHMKDNLEDAEVDYLVAYARVRDATRSLGRALGPAAGDAADVETRTTAAVEALVAAGKAMDGSLVERFSEAAWRSRIAGIAERHRLSRVEEDMAFDAEGFAP